MTMIDQQIADLTAGRHVWAKERAILTLFLSHPGERFSRQGIQDAVWGVGWTGPSNTVPVYLSWLRQKIAPHEIVCDRKRGYHLVIKEAA